MPGLILSDESFLTIVLVVLVLALFAVGFCLFTFYLRLRNEYRERLWKRLEERWTDPLLEALADPDRLPALQDMVEDRYTAEFVDFLLRYFQRVKGEEREILKRAAAPHLDGIAERATSRSVEVRARAIQILGSLGLPGYDGRLVEALDDPSPLVAMVAARALARERDPRYVAPLLRRIPRFRTWRDSALASMLAGMGPGAAAPLRAGRRGAGSVGPRGGRRRPRAAHRPRGGRPGGPRGGAEHGEGPPCGRPEPARRSGTARAPAGHPRPLRVARLRGALPRAPGPRSAGGGGRCAPPPVRARRPLALGGAPRRTRTGGRGGRGSTSGGSRLGSPQGRGGAPGAGGGGSGMRDPVQLS